MGLEIFMGLKYLFLQSIYIIFLFTNLYIYN